MTDASTARKAKVFISYSRDDIAFANQLVAALEGTGFDPLIDRHSIPGGEDWKAQLRHMIVEADSVVFVLSPRSAASKLCEWEVEEADQLNKRVIPIVCASLEGISVPPRLANRNYIYFYAEPKETGSGLLSGLARLVAALNTDLNWIRDHTRLGALSERWQTRNKDAALLLRGDELEDAERWLARKPSGAPEPTDLLRAFLAESRRAEAARLDNERRQLAAIAAAQAAEKNALANIAIEQARRAWSQRITRWVIAAAGALVLVILPLLGAASVRPLQQKVRLFSEFAANNQTSDFRLKLLLLASVLRDSETWIGSAGLDPSDLRQKAREVLLRSPVFGGTFASAAWNTDGKRVIAMESKNGPLIAYDLLDGEDGKPPELGKASPLPFSTYEPDIAPPPSIGFVKQKDGESVAAFRIVSGSVWTGKEGFPLEEAYKLPDTARIAGQWIPRADIFKDHVRIIFLSFSDSAIREMNILDLPGTKLASPSEKPKLSEQTKELIDWHPLEQKAFKQPVLAEDCNAYAFLGKVANPEKSDDINSINPKEEEPMFKLWLREPQKDIDERKKGIKEIILDGIYVKGAVAISRGCRSAVARNDSEEKKQRLYLVPFDDGQAASKPAPISLSSLNEDFANGLYPVGLQQQAELAAAPRGENVWRVGWPTRVGLALLDITADKDGVYHPKPAVPGPDQRPAVPGSDQDMVLSGPDQKAAASGLDQKQMLTGLEGGYDSGSLSLSPDGSRALLIRQDSFASPIRVRAFNLDFVGQWKKLAGKGTDELVREACRIATMQDGSNQLSKDELNIWLKDENAPQPCPKTK